MMDPQTKGLLRECSLGCKMAINSFDQMRDYVKNEELKELIDTCDKKHKSYEEEASKMLLEEGLQEKEPGMMASAFSKLTTEMKLMMRDDSSQVAKLLMDGCNMGIQTLSGYINEYQGASSQRSDEGCAEVSVRLCRQELLRSKNFKKQNARSGGLTDTLALAFILFF